MSNQVYFVVYWDTEAKRWQIDDETFTARFQDGGIWDQGLGGWRFSVDGEEDSEWDLTLDLEARLASRGAESE